MDRTKYVELEDVTCLGETVKAIRIHVEDQECWIPKSHVHPDSDVSGEGDEGRLVITEWIAKPRRL